MDPVSRYVDDAGNGTVGCRLCPRGCTPVPGAWGKCKTRFNDAGNLRILTHGRLVTAAVDPIEKKPLNHFRPGSLTFSVAASGCNLVCPFCQNHSLSQTLLDSPAVEDRPRRVWKPKDVVDAAIEQRCESISFTYSEPILLLEFADLVASCARERNIDIVFVTNGQATKEAARDMAGFLAAANVDLKCFDKDDYWRILGGSLDATLDTIRILREAGVWVEVTTLVVPGFNDRDDQLRSIAGFIASVGCGIPWHVSRFHPAYRWMDRPATPPETLYRATVIGRSAGLEHVYTGNLPGHEGEKTRCAHCDALLIDRVGYRIVAVHTEGGCCKMCGEPIDGVGFP